MIVTALCAVLSMGALCVIPAASIASPRAEQAFPLQPAHRRTDPGWTALASQVRQLGVDFAGDVGIAIEDVQTGQVMQFDGETYFPQQSVSKFWVTLTALEMAEHRRLDLNSPVTLTTGDLTLFHQPISAEIRARGRFVTTLDDLIHRAMQQSDNTANDFVLRSVGGPAAVRSFLDRHGVDAVRFGPGERLMQSRLAGISWQPEYSIGRAFYVARNKVPAERRRSAFAAYIANPVDGATPVAMVRALARLQRGELLSPPFADRLLRIMSETKTGPLRLKGGLAPGWSLAHKTGTGQQFEAYQTGYNDVGIVTSPEGRSYAVAVMIRKTAAPIAHRMALMQNVTRSIVAFDRSLALGDDTQLVSRDGRGAPSGVINTPGRSVVR